MFPLHPPTVHVPIGLLIGNALLTLLYLRQGERALEVSAYHCLRLGFLFLLPTIIGGVIDAARHLASPNGAEALFWINAHALSGALLTIVYWQAWQLRRRNPTVLDDSDTRRGYLARIIIGAILIVISGFLGGHMVYTLRVGVGS